MTIYFTTYRSNNSIIWDTWNIEWVNNITSVTIWRGICIIRTDTIRADLDNIKLRCTVAYYGGAVGGISLTIEYEINATRYYYIVSVYEAKTISVKYKPDFYVKVNNQWKGRTLTSLIPKINGEHIAVKKLYVKIGGTWKSVD